MNPSPVIYEFRVRQMVSDVRQPTGVHRDIDGAAFRVVAVVRALDGIVEFPAAEAAVDVYRLVEVVSQGLQHLLAEPD